MLNLKEFILVVDLDKNICSNVLDYLTNSECKWEDHWFTDSSTYEKVPGNKENILVTAAAGIDSLLPIKDGEAFHAMLWEKIGTYLM